MKEYTKIIEERDKERELLKLVPYEKRQTEAYGKRVESFMDYHKNVVVPIELKIGRPATRIVYAVCVYNEMSNNFRNIYNVLDSFDNAKRVANELKNKSHWNMPIIIIQVTFFRKNTLSSYDFDSVAPRELVFSEDQKIVWKHKCGYTMSCWIDILKDKEKHYIY